jgi:hypothetical protein
MHTNRRSALNNRHFIADGPCAMAALVSLLTRVTNALRASAPARRVTANYVTGECDCGKRRRVRQFVTTRW